MGEGEEAGEESRELVEPPQLVLSSMDGYGSFI